MQLVSTSHHHFAPIPPTMAPTRPSKVTLKSSSTFSQPPKGTLHKQKARWHVRDEASESEESETTKASKMTQKRKRDAELSSDESTDTMKKKKSSKKAKKKKKKKKPTNTMDEDGDESDDETIPQDEAPDNMDENEQALSMSSTSALCCHSDFCDRKGYSELDIACIHALPLPAHYQN